MPKILTGIFLILIGFVSCVGGPVLFAMKLLPEKVVDVRHDAPTRFAVSERGHYFLRLTTDGFGQGQGAELRAKLPDGEYGFRPVDGTLIPVSTADEILTNTTGLGFVSIGSVDLEPGQYEVVVPTLPSELHLDVGVSKALSNDADLKDLGVGPLAAMAGGALLGIVGLVLLIVGIIQVSRRPRRNEA